MRRFLASFVLARAAGTALVLLVLLVSLVSLVACNDAETHVYSAQLYETSSDCLDDYAALAEVGGETAASTCAPVCLVASGVYYVSAVCAPYPDGFVIADRDAGSDPVCVAAIAAFSEGKSCSAPVDAGRAPIEATVEATTD